MAKEARTVPSERNQGFSALLHGIGLLKLEALMPNDPPLYSKRFEFIDVHGVINGKLTLLTGSGLS